MCFWAFCSASITSSARKIRNLCFSIYGVCFRSLIYEKLSELSKPSYTSILQLNAQSSRHLFSAKFKWQLINQTFNESNCVECGRFRKFLCRCQASFHQNSQTVKTFVVMLANITNLEQTLLTVASNHVEVDYRDTFHSKPFYNILLSGPLSKR